MDLERAVGQHVAAVARAVEAVAVGGRDPLGARHEALGLLLGPVDVAPGQRRAAHVDLHPHQIRRKNKTGRPVSLR